MQSDILIISAQADKLAAAKLALELELMGADVDVRPLTAFAALKTQFLASKATHAMTLLFVTKAFAQTVKTATLAMTAIPESVAIVGFSLKRSEQKIVQSKIPGVVFSSARTLERFAHSVIDELRKPSRAGRLSPRAGTKAIWKSPLYIFKARTGLAPADDKEILVDVTWSAKPTRPEMSPALQQTLRATLECLGNKKLKILDFGAGKLRHTIPLLKLGHSVAAVDYRSLYEKPSPDIKKNLQEARRFKKHFSQVIYPAEFATSTGQYDLIMLINVLNVMPEPLERYFVLHKCNQHLSHGGHVLWFCQHGDADQLRSVKDLTITDGGCTSKKGRKTFYKDYNSQDMILQTMDVMGFQQVPIKVATSSNHALLFQRTKPPALDVNLVIHESRHAIERRVFGGELDSETAVADVLDGNTYLGYGGALAVALTKIDPGKASAYSYENLVAPIVKYVFQKEFIRATIETQYEIMRGRQRIDIKAEYRESSTLRSSLGDMNLKSSWIPIECKNYNKPLGNEEYGQLVMRCDKHHRRFGIILCRDVKDRPKVNEACHNIYNQHEYAIVVLDDADLSAFLQYADDERFADIKNSVVRRIQDVLDLS